MKVHVDAIAAYSPGFADWPSLKSIINGDAEFVTGEDERYQPEMLPRNERRRATTSIRLAFRLAEAVRAVSSVDLSHVASVFASSGGDYDVIDAICRALTTADKFVSPTLFHNSVHNAAAGYWGIACGSQQSSTSLSAFDETFVMGLLEAATYCTIEQQPTLLVAYDIVVPQPLRDKRAIAAPFGVALLLQPTPGSETIATLNLRFTPEVDVDTNVVTPSLQPLVTRNPIARALPLLEAIALKQGRTVNYAGQSAISVEMFH